MTHPVYQRNSIPNDTVQMLSVITLNVQLLSAFVAIVKRYIQLDEN